MAPLPSRASGRRRAPMAEINVTPLVDVMLVLLIIFMVTAPLLTAGVLLTIGALLLVPTSAHESTLRLIATFTVFGVASSLRPSMSMRTRLDAVISPNSSP